MTVACTPEAQRALGLSHKYRCGADSTAPLVVFVHGRAGTEDVMWAFRRCVPDGFSIIAPQAPLPDPVGGYSWWNIATTDPREGGTDAAAILSRFIEAAKEFYGLTPRTVIGCGFSQGAGALSVALQRGVPFGGVALLAGFVVELDDASLKDTATRIFMAHGTNDEMVSVERARRGREYLAAHGLSVDYVEDPVGHKVGTSGMKALTAWLADFQ